MKTDTEQNNWDLRNTPSVLGVKSGTGKKRIKEIPNLLQRKGFQNIQIEAA